jgi:Tfp pilus assembly protein PilF
MRAMVVLLLTTLLALTSACATPAREGRHALSRGSYAEAARHFEEALARDPGRIEDQVGLGVARYKLDALDDAEKVFRDAVARAPGALPAHMYLALIALRKGETTEADGHLARALALAPHPRLAAQIDRTRRVLPASTTPELRTYLAASLEDGYQWTGELAGAVQAARAAELDRLYLWPGYAHRCW